MKTGITNVYDDYIKMLDEMILISYWFVLKMRSMSVWEILRGNSCCDGKASTTNMQEALSIARVLKETDAN